MPPAHPRWPDTWEWLKSTTLCPFARMSRVDVAPGWSAHLSPADNVRALAGALREFCAGYPSRKAHGFAVEIGTLPGEAMLIDRCVALFSWLVFALVQMDGQGRPDDAVLKSAGWQFSFAGRRLFLNLFAPCYPPTHSKHLPPGDRFIVFMQPEESFDYCGINSGQRAVKHAIRRRFSDAGRPYPGELIDQRVEAHLYVFPHGLSDPPVQWWKVV